MKGLQDICVCLGLLLIMNIEVAETKCCRNTTLKFFDDQMQVLQNSMRRIVNDDSCCKSNINNPVGFQVHMGSYKTYTKGSVWVYDKVVTNTHSAYSASTGKFTAPERGLYMFSYGTLSDPGKMSHAGLHVNGNVKSWQACRNSGGNNQWFTCSDTTILLLEKNDVVYIADYYTTALVRTSYTYFSGAKLN